MLLTCGAQNRLHREVPCSPLGRPPQFPPHRGTALPPLMAVVRVIRPQPRWTLH